jgi:hypothetical protein
MRLASNLLPLPALAVAYPNETVYLMDGTAPLL